MKKITKRLSATVSAAALSAFAVAVSAESSFAQIQKGIDSADPTGNQPSLFNGDDSIFVNIINALLFLIGAISVVMLIYGGIRYTSSGGNATSVTAAKNTIMYAIIGIIVAFLAFAVVNWVLGSLTGA